MTLVIWTWTKEPTRVKYLTGAQQAAFPSLDTLIWNDTCWGIIPEKNLTSATSAIMLAPLQLTCRGTWESKIYWDLSSATSVMQVVHVTLLRGMHKLTFEESYRRNASQVRPVRLCLRLFKWVAESHEKAHCTETFQVHPVQCKFQIEQVSYEPCTNS